jgi:hypothetical protein
MLCHQALLAAYAREERTVTQDTIRSAAGELEIAPPRRAERLALLGAGAGKMLGASKGLAGMALDLVRDRWPRLRFPTRRFPTLQLPIPSRTTAAAAGLAVVVLAGVLFFGSGPSRPPAEPAADVPLAPVDREESSLHALFASVGRSLSAVVDGLIPADGYLAERGRGRR